MKRPARLVLPGLVVALLLVLGLSWYVPQFDSFLARFGWDRAAIEKFAQGGLAMIALAAAACAAGLWLWLPGGRAISNGTKALGAMLGVVGLVLLGWNVPAASLWLSNSAPLVLGGTTVFAAAATITCRSPVYSAIWFALTLVGTASLFMVLGAEFLAVATIVVYAGAIVVTFLFVLMLTIPQGNAVYDRVSWEPLVSSCAGMLLVAVLALALSGLASQGIHANGLGTAGLPIAQGTLAADGITPQPGTSEVGQFGSVLFSRHLVAVEAAGVLLLVALVGAAAIVAQDRLYEESIRPKPQVKSRLDSTNPTNSTRTQPAATPIPTHGPGGQA